MAYFLISSTSLAIVDLSSFEDGYSSSSFFSSSSSALTVVGLYGSTSS
jgi:hypothetical protein